MTRFVGRSCRHFGDGKFAGHGVKKSDLNVQACQRPKFVSAASGGTAAPCQIRRFRKTMESGRLFIQCLSLLSKLKDSMPEMDRVRKGIGIPDLSDRARRFYAPEKYCFTYGDGAILAAMSPTFQGPQPNPMPFEGSAAFTPAMQESLFDGLCGCLERTVEKAGLCRPCYARQYRSRRFFKGLRVDVLRRDRNACRACGSRHQIVIHHRKLGVNATDCLITLCSGCHARIHRSYVLRCWVSAITLELWREIHKTSPMQLQFVFVLEAQQNSTFASAA